MNRFLFAFFLVIPAFVVVAGCGGKKSSVTKYRNQVVENKVDFLEQSLDYVFSEERFDYTSVNKEIATNLNTWLESQEKAVDWSQPKILETLPADLQTAPNIKSLPGLEYEPSDGRFLHEIGWLKLCVENITAQQRPAHFRYLIGTARKEMSDEEQSAMLKSGKQLSVAIAKLHPELGEVESATEQHSDVEKLAFAVQVFDWITRTVQLVDMSARPDEEEIVRGIVPTALTPAQAGVPGPGYQRMPWHTMAMGLGDKIERGRLFIGMLRQLNIPAVYLGVKAKRDETRIEPWAVAVLIKGELYLFDPWMGLPIPGAELKGIAKLSAVADDPSILSQLDLLPAESRKNEDYPVGSLELKHVYGLLDIASPYMSKRMKVVEPKVTGNRQMTLTVDADQLADQIKSQKGIAEVRLWTLPLYSEEFRRVIDEPLERGDERLGAYELLSRERVFHMRVVMPDSRFVGIAQARHRFLCGIYNESEESRHSGSTLLLSQLRLSDNQIEDFESNPIWKAAYGLTEQGDMSVGQYRERIDLVKAKLRMLRSVASYWLALSHFENGDASNAKVWLSQVPESDMLRQWSTGEKYLYVRCEEALLNFDEAITALSSDQSVARYGNIIRARLLTKFAK